MDSGKAAGESDPRLIHTGYGQYSAGHRMSTRLRVFVWIVVAVAMATWIAAISRLLEKRALKRLLPSMSALPPKADMCGALPYVR